MQLKMLNGKQLNYIRKHSSKKHMRGITKTGCAKSHGYASIMITFTTLYEFNVILWIKSNYCIEYFDKISAKFIFQSHWLLYGVYHLAMLNM